MKVNYSNWKQVVLGIVLSESCLFSSWGADSFWINTTSGNFTDTVNWASGSTPLIGDNAIFTNNAGYQVNWTTSWTNANAFYTNTSGIATITNNIGSGNVWWLTNSFVIGSQPNATSAVMQISGFLLVTNTGSSGVIVGLTNTMGASFTLTNGADVRANAFTVGSQTNTAGTVLLTGSGTSFTNTATTFVGSAGTGSRLTVADGAVLQSLAMTIGSGVQANNNLVVVTNGGSVVLNANGNNGLVVGGNGNSNELRILDGGKVSVYKGVFRVGGAGASDKGASNLVLVSGANSVLTVTNSSQSGTFVIGFGQFSTNNSLIVSNQALLYARSPNAAQIGAGGRGRLTVTGSGSIWSNELSDVQLGANNGSVSYSSNTLTISDGGVAVLQSNLIIGIVAGSFANSALITNNGSLLQIGSSLIVGQTSSFNRVTIADSAVVKVASNVFVGQLGVMTNNEILVTGGSLFVTNVAGNGALVVGSGGSSNRVTLNSGFVTVDQLSVTNNAGGINLFSLNGGTLNTKSTTFSNGTSFVVGNGASLATLNLNGGNHFFANGLTVSSNGTLKGTGTAQADTTVQAGGTLAPGASPGILTISGNLTLASNAVFAVELNGTIVGSQYDQVNVIGSVNITDSVLNITLGYTPNPTNGDTFVIVNNDDVDGINGLFRDLTGNVLSNNTEFSEGGGQFKIRYDAGTGNDVVLIAVPEPSMLLLASLGTLCLLRFRRRCQIR